MVVDLYWTLDADLAIGEDGDLRDTSFDVFRSLYQEIRTRVRSSFKDWILHPSLGANLDEYLGRANNRITAEEGKSAIVASLIRNGFLDKNSINIRYVPLGRDWIAYYIQVTVIVPTTGQTRLLKTTLLYDTVEGGLMLL